MSHPSTGREDVYPEDKVSHYPKGKMNKMARKVASEPINHSIHRIKSGAKKLQKMMKGVGAYNMPNNK